MSMEKIVRPFQSFPAFDARTGSKVSEVPYEGPEIVEIVVQGSVDPTLAEELPPAFLSQEAQEWEEASVTTVERRIENPDDPSQYVIVQDVTEYQLRNKLGGDRIVIRPFKD